MLVFGVAGLRVIEQAMQVGAEDLAILGASAMGTAAGCGRQMHGRALGDAGMVLIAGVSCSPAAGLFWL